MRFAGVDGCRAGWLLVWLEEQRVTDVALVPGFAELAEVTADAALTLVDIPIGLKGPEGQTERLCETAGRARLGGRRSSLFQVPVRAAVHAGDYREGSERNHAATGRRLSRQTWGIVPKIAEADRVMSARPALQQRMRESHPELCFAALNQWQPMSHNKKRPEGEAERVRLLSQYIVNTAAVLEQARQRFRRTQVATDDILDAMVLAASAGEAWAVGLPTLPQVPERDAQGLRMELVVPRDPSGS